MRQLSRALVAAVLPKPTVRVVIDASVSPSTRRLRRQYDAYSEFGVGQPGVQPARHDPAPSRRRRATSRALRTFQISSQGHLRAQSSVTWGKRVVASAAGRTSMSASISKPDARSSAMSSPCGRWNSTESSSAHSTRCMPKYGRSSRSAAGSPSVSRAAHDRQRRVDEEHEPPARAQQPRRLGDPLVRIAPDARAVLGDREVEARVVKRRLLGVAVHERELDPELLLQGARGGELALGVVDPDGASAAPGQPRGHVARPAAELDRVEAVEVVGQHVQLGLGDGEDPPPRLVARPVAAAGLDPLAGEGVPRGAVARDVLGQIAHGSALALGLLGELVLEVGGLVGAALRGALLGLARRALGVGALLALALGLLDAQLLGRRVVVVAAGIRPQANRDRSAGAQLRRRRNRSAPSIARGARSLRDSPSTSTSPESVSASIAYSPPGTATSTSPESVCATTRRRRSAAGHLHVAGVRLRVDGARAGRDRPSRRRSRCAPRRAPARRRAPPSTSPESLRSCALRTSMPSASTSPESVCTVTSAPAGTVTRRSAEQRSERVAAVGGERRARRR